jgi:hypothetical protein
MATAASSLSFSACEPWRSAAKWKRAPTVGSSMPFRAAKMRYGTPRLRCTYSNWMSIHLAVCQWTVMTLIICADRITAGAPARSPQTSAPRSRCPMGRPVGHSTYAGLTRCWRASGEREKRRRCERLPQTAATTGPRSRGTLQERAERLAGTIRLGGPARDFERLGRAQLAVLLTQGLRPRVQGSRRGVRVPPSRLLAHAFS